ncbi:ABC-type dipeptide/oligopeptide/nickel transport system, permease component [Halovivax ruber XH-70]|uniref:ABC-type dipeptide/oligopeptide/nickel transport system, permease component n=1 Tax=Halovivax ruber (strain DSM 18193 / JCM 13892 / XH-70) TaxID=797302 RepID=L0IFX2_HALRX|nr:ABC transporter permease [Halovivax ruber]AGB17664.1 ABC-type dipeptide/oligopeptide/nickel transport system, permease component [Halovivax ruber XH-70]
MAVSSESQVEGGDGASGEVAAKTWRDTLGRIKRDTTARWGLYVISVVLVVGLYAFVDTYLSTLTFGAFDNYTMAEAIPIFDHPEHLPAPGESQPNQPPAFHVDGSLEYPLGTDPEGRDYFTRLVYGSQISVSVGIVATLLGTVAGTIVGAVSGYYGGRVDDILMRSVETLYAIPGLILIIVFTEFASGGERNIQYAIIGVSLTTIPIFARIIRSRVLSVREMDYIEAARAAGVKDRYIIAKHIIPNSFAPVLVYATLEIGVVILIVAGLSFLGYGAQPPTPDWGRMLAQSYRYMHSNIWLSIWPGLAIMFTIMGFNLFGDGLQDALDPRIDN